MNPDRDKEDRTDGIEILRHLIAINTVNPPGKEKAAAEYLAELLAPYGFCKSEAKRS